jgi:hypothetical protein
MMDGQLAMDFDGRTFVKKLDGSRLSKQLSAIRDLMADGIWRSPEEIERATGINWASASARLRDLRKHKFGGFTVLRRRRGEATKGLFEYRIQVPSALGPCGPMKEGEI